MISNVSRVLKILDDKYFHSPITIGYGLNCYNNEVMFVLKQKGQKLTKQTIYLPYRMFDIKIKLELY